MNRRDALKNLVIASGGLITLPLWMGCGADGSPATHLSSFSSEQQKILAGMANTIIPAGNNRPGALTMEVDKFLQKLIDDWQPKDVQDNVKEQLEAIEKSAKQSYGKAFAECTQAQREELLKKFSTSPIKEEKDFYTLMRTETIRGFTTSREVMEKYLNYKVAPGHYYGCVAIKA